MLFNVNITFMFASESDIKYKFFSIQESGNSLQELLREVVYAYSGGLKKNNIDLEKETLYRVEIW